MELYKITAHYTVDGQQYDYENLILAEDYTWTNITFWLKWDNHDVKIFKYSVELLDQDVFKDGIKYNGAMSKDESMTFEDWLRYFKRSRRK